MTALRAPAAPRAPHPADSTSLIGRIRGKRVPLTAVFVLGALVPTALGARPADLLDPQWSVRFVLPWLLMLGGVGVRVWGSGNLRKNQEITDTGIYRMVRHPLYLGSLLVLLAYFLSVGNPWIGAALFVGLVALVFYPTMLHEEANLARRYPDQVDDYRRLPRLVPNPLIVPEALRSDRFTLGAARQNLGLRTFWFLLAIPLLTKLLIWLQGMA